MDLDKALEILIIDKSDFISQRWTIPDINSQYKKSQNFKWV